MVVWKLHDFKPEKKSQHVPWKGFRRWFAKILSRRSWSWQTWNCIGDTTWQQTKLNHFKSLFRKAFWNLGVLQRISNLLDMQKKNLFSKISVFSWKKYISSKTIYLPVHWWYVLSSQKKLQPKASPENSKYQKKKKKKKISKNGSGGNILPHASIM